MLELKKDTERKIEKIIQSHLKYDCICEKILNLNLSLNEAFVPIYNEIIDNAFQFKFEHLEMWKRI